MAAFPVRATLTTRGVCRSLKVSSCHHAYRGSGHRHHMAVMVTGCRGLMAGKGPPYKEEIEDERLPSTRIMKLIGKGQLQRAREVLLREAGGDAKEFALLINACGWAGKWSDAVALLEHMRKHGPPPDTSIFNSVMVACSKAGQHQRAAALLEEMKADHHHHHRPDATTYNTLIRACGLASNGTRQERQDRAMALFHEMRERQVSPDANTLSALLSTFMGEKDSASALLPAMQQQGLQVDSYNWLLLACGRAGSPVAALPVLKALVTAQGVEPDGLACNLVLSACCVQELDDRLVVGPTKRAGHRDHHHPHPHRHGRRDYTYPRAGRDLIMAMLPSKILSTNAALCTTAIRYCAAYRDLELLQLIQKGGLPLDTHLYTWVLTAYKNARHWEQVLRCGQSMREKGVPFNTLACNTMMLAYLKLRREKETLAFFRTFQSEWGIPPDEQSYYSAIMACGKTQMEGVHNLLRESVQVLGGPREPPYLAAITVYAQRGAWKTPLALLADMRAQGLKPSSSIYSNVIAACSKGHRWRDALQLLEKMEEGSEGLPPPTLSCYNNAVDAVAREGMVDQALQLMDRMRDRGIAPDHYTYGSAISACAKAGDVPRALVTLQHMQRQGIQATTVTQGAVMAAFAKAGDMESALCYLRDLPEANTVIMSSAMFACAKAGSWPTTLYLYDQLRWEHISGGGRVDIKAAGVALEALDSSPGKADSRQAEGVPPSSGLILRRLLGVPMYRELCQWGVFDHWSRRWAGVMDLHKYTRPVARVALSMVMDDMAILLPPPPPPSEPTRPRPYLYGHLHNPTEDLVIIVGKSGHLIRDEVRHFLEVECRPSLPTMVQEDNDGRLVVKSKHLTRWVQAQRKNMGGG